MMFATKLAYYRFMADYFGEKTRTARLAGDQDAFTKFYKKRHRFQQSIVRLDANR